MVGWSIMENKSEMVYPFKDMANKVEQNNLATKGWYRAFQVARAIYLIAAGLFGLLILIASSTNGDALEGVFGTAIYAVIVYAIDLGIVYAVRYIAVGK